MAKNKQQKRAERGKRLKKSRYFERRKKYEERRGILEEGAARIKYYRKEENVYAEILLDAISLEATPDNLRKALSYQEDYNSINSVTSKIGFLIDDLFAVSYDIIPEHYHKKSPESALAIILNNFKASYKDYEKRAGSMLNNDIGRIIADTDDVISIIRICCEKRQADLESLLAEKNELPQGPIKKSIEKMHSIDLSSADIYREWTVERAYKEVEEMVRVLEGIRLRIPLEFYKDFFSAVSSFNASTVLFFCNFLYPHIEEKAMESGREYSKKYSDLLEFKYALKFYPEEILPDPAYFSESVRICREMNNLKGGKAAVDAAVAFFDSGYSIDEAVRKLGKIKNIKYSYSAISELLGSSEENKVFMLNLFCETKGAVDAYEALKTHFVPKEVYAFLRDYGDYIIGEKTFSEIVSSVGKKPEAIRLLVENALYICCGESSEELISITLDMQKSAKVLMHYSKFARSEETYKQLAVICYIKNEGAQGLDKFAKSLEKFSDETIARVFIDETESSFIEKIIEGDVPEEYTHPLKKLNNYELILDYGFAGEITSLDESSLERVDLGLTAIKDSPYRNFLLSQANFRRKFIEIMKEGDLNVKNSFAKLPLHGNPYLELSRMLTPAEEAAHVEVQNPEFDRIILIYKRIPEETIQYLQKSFGVPVRHVTKNGAANKFSAISGKDIIIYHTEIADHTSYYKAKQLAEREGALFLHTERTNKKLIEELIRSKSKLTV